VLAFDADSAGQGAAERFYEWEQKYQVQVSVLAELFHPLAQIHSTHLQLFLIVV
jgi:DNA primase